MTEGKPSIFKGGTNLFSSGSGSMVLIVPKSIIKDLKLDTENKKAYFNIYLNKKTKEIIYKFIEEEEK